MPKTKREVMRRVPVRIPKPMIDEVDRIVENHKELGYNRQQFIESAIREKIVRTRLIERGLKEEAQSSRV